MPIKKYFLNGKLASIGFDSFQEEELESIYLLYSDSFGEVKKERWAKMIDWSKYIVEGKFISHSGLELDYKWEFDLLREYPEDLELIRNILKALLYPNYHVIGIRTMGWEVVKTLRNAHEYPFKDFTHDGHYFCVFDDVITTGNSIREVMGELILTPHKIICIVNRSDLQFIEGVRIYEIREILGGKQEK